MIKDEITKKLTERFQPQQLSVIDNSHQHAGHPGAKAGGGHYTIEIVSEAFEGKNLLERHRMIYETLSNLMKQEIHALSIEAKSPEEQ